MERTIRLTTDTKFSDLCSHIEKSQTDRSAEVAFITQHNHRRLSSNMAASLTWNC